MRSPFFPFSIPFFLFLFHSFTFVLVFNSCVFICGFQLLFVSIIKPPNIYKIKFCSILSTMNWKHLFSLLWQSFEWGKRGIWEDKSKFCLSFWKKKDLLVFFGRGGANVYWLFFCRRFDVAIFYGVLLFARISSRCGVYVFFRSLFFSIF